MMQPPGQPLVPVLVQVALILVQVALILVPGKHPPPLQIASPLVPLSLREPC